MARNSNAYNKLCQRESVLQAEYLPPINPTGNYSQKQQDDTRAYSLLVHAEIESFLETVVWEKAHVSLTKWNTNHRYNSQVLLSLSCFIDQNSTIKSEGTTATKLARIVGSYRVTINANNGIKEKNVHELVLPIGIEESTLDATLMNTLNSFGTTRGSFAHSGAIHSIPDPASIKNDVANILSALSDLDKEINSLK